MNKNLSSISKTNKNQKVMLFDLDSFGHHAGYLNNLVEHWGQNNYSGSLVFITSPFFVKEHPDVYDACLKYERKNVIIQSISSNNNAEIIATKNAFLRYRKAWNLFIDYAKKLSVDHASLLYLDFFQLASILGSRPPCSFSAIYFRPTFHYRYFFHYKPSFMEIIRDWRKKLLLSAVLQNPFLTHLFCLDPFAVEYIKKAFQTKTKIIYLPDPVKIYSNNDSQVKHLRQELGIQTGRMVFLLFGAISKRKGIYELFNGVALLAAEMCRKIAIVIAGPIKPTEEPVIRKQASSLCQSLPVEIIFVNKFIVDRDIQTYFHLSDAIIALYQSHMGMSAILVRAAAAQKPVIASDYGVMGEIAKRNRLGLTLNSKDPKQIARGIVALIESPMVPEYFHPDKAKAFAESNSADRFAKVFFENIGYGN
jgi:glycosyltransferase involved in cell wall biosynthesis